MTAWPTERSAILNMIEHFGSGIFAIVMDSYDYTRALDEVLPSVKSEKVGQGGYITLRPDSGNPVEVVLQVRHRPLADGLRMVLSATAPVSARFCMAAP